MCKLFCGVKLALAEDLILKRRERHCFHKEGHIAKLKAINYYDNVQAGHV